MTMQLRPYQREAVDAAFRWCAMYEGHPLVVIPTGGGKSLILGTMIADAIANAPGTRALVLAHRKELLAQNARAVASAVPMGSIGFFSAGLKRKDTEHQIIVAGIQSLGRDPFAAGAFDLVLVDEAHLVPPADDTLYRKFIRAVLLSNPDARFIGLTATPYRMGAGLLHRGQGALFTDIAYEAPVRELVDAGYLCRLISKATVVRLDASGVAMRGGEYVQRDLEAAVDRDELTAGVVAETLVLAHDRRKILVFCSGVAHAEHVAAAFVQAGVAASCVHGGLDAEQRASRLDRFRTGELRVLTSMDVLTTGYDEPAIDCIVTLRPTKSTGLYVQMLGRGFRLHPDKQNTLVLDFAGVVAMHGPVDRIEVKDKESARGEGAAPVKECPECQTLVFAGLRECPECAFAFPEPERPPILPAASLAPVMSDELAPVEWTEISNIEYHLHAPRDEGKRCTLRVEYYAGYRRVASEWVCLDHDPGSFPRRKAESWWARRSPDPCPGLDAALDGAEGERLVDGLLVPSAIATQPDGRYTRVVDYRFPAERSALPRACWTCEHGNVAGDFCTLAAMVPPPDVQRDGCESWAEMTDEAIAA